MYYFSALKANARKAYARITQSHITIAFFIFSFVYCFAQSILQSLLLSFDVEYRTLVSDIVKGGNIPPANFTFLEGQRGHLHLQICDDIPFGQIHPCTTVFSSTGNSEENVQVVLQQPFVLDGWKQGLDVTTMVNASNVTNVMIKTLDGRNITLSEQCVQILLFPSQILHTFRNEDITWLGLQFWLLSISFFAILYGSVPHTLAALMTRTLESGWAIYATRRGPTFQANFQELLTGTPCSLDLFSAYWNKRHVYEVTNLMLSIPGLIVFSYLSWTLVKVYNVQSFKCVGAPQHVMRVHKFFVAILACLQLEVFVLITSVGLWSTILTTTAIAYISAHTPVYKALYIGTIILLLPWIAMGWYAIRREMKRMMIFFLGIAFVITVGWSIMFYSKIYRWSFLQWPYLGCYTVSSFILLIMSMGLGIVCRMNFGKGLAQYLHAEETLASLNFAPDSFPHDTTPHRMLNTPSKESDTKLQGQYYSTQMYFVQPFLKDGSGSDLEHQQTKDQYDVHF